MWSRIFFFIIAVPIGVAMMIYRERLARGIGKNELAERYLGAGGTYTMWSLIGMIVIFVGLLVLMGKFSFMGM